MERSNIFTVIENQFKLCNADEIKKKVAQAFEDLISAMKENGEEKTIILTLITGAKIGVASCNGNLNFLEKELINTTFGEFLDGDVESVYELIAEGIAENDYEIVRALTMMGNNIALPFLCIILGFAYIDGKVRDDVLEQLDGIYGINLAALLMQNSLGEVDEEENNQMFSNEDISSALKNMGYSCTGEIYVRTFTKEDLQIAIKIAKEFEGGISLDTSRYDDDLAAENTYICDDDLKSLLHELVQNIIEEIPNCLIFYRTHGFQSVTGMTDYCVWAKFPSENDVHILSSRDFDDEVEYYFDEEGEYCEKSEEAYIGAGGLKSIKDVFYYIKETNTKVNTDQARDIFNIFGYGEIFDPNSDKWGMENIVLGKLPAVIPIVGTAYEGRNERIEKIKVGDRILLEAKHADDDDEWIIIEVMNDKKESLGHLQESRECECSDLALVLDKVEAFVESVTPLSARRKNARNSLLNVKIVPKRSVEEKQKKLKIEDSIIEQINEEKIDTINNAQTTKKEEMQQRLQQLSEQRKQYAVMRRDVEIENYIKQLRYRAEKNYKKLNNALKKREEVMSQQSFESIVDPKLLRHFSLMEEDVQEYGNTIGLMASEVMGKFMDVYEETSPSILLDMISTIEEAIDDVNDFRVDFTDIGGYLEYEWPETCDYYFLKQNLQNMKQNLENAKKHQNWTSAMEEEYARLEYALRYEIDEEDVENHKKYLNGCECMKSAKTEAEYKEAAQIFKQIPRYLDADELKEKCELAGKRAKELESAQNKLSNAQYKMETVRKKYEEFQRQTLEQEQTCQRLAEEVAKKSEAYPEDRQRLEEKCSLEIVGVNEKIRVSNEKIECLNREIAQANEELNRLSFFAMGKKKELQSRIATLNMQSDNEKHQVDELKKEEEDLNIKRDSMLKQLDHEVEYAQRELETANDLYVELKRKLEKSEAELTEAGKQYEMAKKELEML